MDYTSLGCCALAFVLYLNALNAGFVYDDRRAILGNTDVSGKTPWHQAFQNDYWGTPLSDSGSHGSYRPLCVLSFKFNYLMGGYTPWGYHLINNLMHCLATGLVVKLARHFLSSNYGIWITGTLFAAHPIHTETVAGIVGRADLAACILYLLTYLTFLKHLLWRERNDTRQWLALSLTILFAVCALLFKETAISALMVCTIFDVARGFCGFNDKNRCRTLSILIAAFATIAYIRLTTVSNGPQHSFSTADNPIAKTNSALTRFLTFFYLPIFNFKLLLYPNILSFDWGMDAIPRITTIWDSRNLISLSFYTIIVVILWKCFRNLLATMGTRNLIKNSSKSLILMKKSLISSSSSSSSSSSTISSSSSSSSSSSFYCSSNTKKSKKYYGQQPQQQQQHQTNQILSAEQKSQEIILLRQQNNHYNQNIIEHVNQQEQQEQHHHHHHPHYHQNQLQQRKSRMKRIYNMTTTTAATTTESTSTSNAINQNVNVLTSIQNCLLLSNSKICRGTEATTSSISTSFLNNNNNNNNNNNSSNNNNNNNSNRNKNIDFLICNACKQDRRHTNLCRQLNNNNNVMMSVIVNPYTVTNAAQHTTTVSTNSSTTNNTNSTTTTSYYSNDISCRCHSNSNYLEQKINHEIVQNRFRKSCTPPLLPLSSSSTSSSSAIINNNCSRRETIRSTPTTTTGSDLGNVSSSHSAVSVVAAAVRSKLDKHHHHHHHHHQGDDVNNNNNNSCRLTPRSSRSSSSCSNSTTSSNTSNSSCSSTISSCSSCCTNIFFNQDSIIFNATTQHLLGYLKALTNYINLTPSNSLLLESKMSQQNINSIIIIMSIAFLTLPFLPATNLFFYVGFVVAERLLYLPSVGYCLLIGFGISKLMELYVDNCRKKFIAILCMAIVLSALSIRTWNRNYDWYDEESLYRSAIKVNPPKALGNLGSVLSSQGRYAEAEEVLLEALKHRPNMADVHFNLGILNQNQQNYKKAVENFQRAIQFRPNLAVAYLNLGTSLIALGRCREAASILKDGTKVDGTGVRDRMQHESSRMSSYLQLGSLYAEQGKLQRSLAVYREALHSFPFHFQHQVLLQRMGDIFGRLQQWDEAEKHHRAALDMQPDNVAAHLSYGITLAKNSSRISEAELWFKRALKLAPHQSSVYHHYADFLVSTSRYEEAISYRLQAVDVTPNDYALTVAVATTYRLLDNKIEAEKWYRKAVNLRPDDARAHTNLGAILHLLGRTHKAAASYKEALRLQPGDPTTLGNLAKLGIIEV